MDNRSHVNVCQGCDLIDNVNQNLIQFLHFKMKKQILEMLIYWDCLRMFNLH